MIIQCWLMIDCDERNICPHKQLCICTECVPYVYECLQKLALWAWMCYFWGCYFLCSSIGITTPTDWQYFSPLDAQRACPLGNDYSHTLQGLLLCKTGKMWGYRTDMLAQGDTWPHSHKVLQWTLLRAERDAARLLQRTVVPSTAANIVSEWPGS